MLHSVCIRSPRLPVFWWPVQEVCTLRCSGCSFLFAVSSAVLRFRQLLPHVAGDGQYLFGSGVHQFFIYLHLIPFFPALYFLALALPMNYVLQSGPNWLSGVVGMFRPVICFEYALHCYERMVAPAPPFFLISPLRYSVDIPAPLYRMQVKGAEILLLKNAHTIPLKLNYPCLSN